MGKKKAREKVKIVKEFLTEGIWKEDVSATGTLKRLGLQLLKILTTTFRGYQKDGCGLQASALTYITIVSLVPMLAIMFSFSKGIGMQRRLYDSVGVERIVEKKWDAELGNYRREAYFRVKEVKEEIKEGENGKGIIHDLPESMQEIIIQIFTYVDRTNFAALGVVGSLMLLIGVVMSIAKLEKCFNLIWGVSKWRGFLKSFPSYLVVLIVAPLLFMTVMSVNSLLMSQNVLGWLSSHVGAATGLMVFLCRLVVGAIVMLFFMFLFTFMPNTKVKARTGILGGMFASILWLTVLWLYLKMQVGLAKYNTIYGTFAALPFFLALVYANWCIVLLGCEFSYAVQYHRFMRIEKMEQPMPAGACLLLGQLAMFETCKAFEGDEHSWNPEEYAVKNSIPMSQLRYVVGVLVRAKLLLQIESSSDDDRFVPGCPPDTITQATVEEAFRENDSVDGKQYFEMLPPHFANGLKERYQSFLEKLGEVNFADAVRTGIPEQKQLMSVTLSRGMKRTMLACLMLLGLEAFGEPLRVFVSIAPQLESVRTIGGELVVAESLVPPGASPETYVPQPRSIASLAKASFLLTIGVPFEKALLPKVRGTFPKLAIVDGRSGMDLMPMEEGIHAEGHGHHHGGVDPHVWLSIGNMKIHARTVARELSARLPEHHDEIERRAQAYIASLEKLDDEIRRCLEPLKGRTAMVFHPAFGYYLKRYGLQQMAVELGGREPTGRHLGALLRTAKKNRIRCVFVQPQFNGKSVQTIAREIGGTVVTLDPLPSEYSAGMRQLCTQLLTIGNFP